MKFLCGSFFLSSLLWFNPSLFRPEYAIVMLGILAGLFQGRSSSICKFKRELWLLAALVAAAVVTVGGQILAGANFIWRDSMVTLMFAYYAGVIIFVGMVSNSNISDRGGWKFGLAVSFLIATISIFQYFNILKVNSVLLPSSGVAEWLRDEVSWKRTVGTIGNPNYWGFVISVCLAMLTHLVFWRGRILLLPLFLGLLVSLILTGSRSALICWVSGTIIGGILVASFARELPRTGMSLTATLLLTIGASGLGISDYYENKGRFSVSNVDTLMGRVAVWQMSLQESSEDLRTLLIGQGPRKGVDTLHWGDNSYVKIFRDYGLVSLGLYLTLLAVMFKRILKKLRVQDEEGRAWSIVSLFVLLQWCVFELSADTWFFVRVSAPVIALYTFVIARPEICHSLPRRQEGTSANDRPSAVS